MFCRNFVVGRPGLNILVGVLSLILLVAIQAKAECDQCFFTSGDSDDCKVYGKIDGQLIPWNRASQACIDIYGNNVASIDPFGVGCDPRSVNTFVNSGISGGNIPNSILGGLGVAEGGFFVEQQGGRYGLKDSITINGVVYDCSNSASTCYDAMKTYFQSTTGANEVDDVCAQIQNRIINDRQVEQTTLRNRLCREVKEEGNSLDESCGELKSQIEARVQANPNESCPNYAFGTQNTIVPGCEGKDPTSDTVGGGGGGGGTNDDDGSTSSSLVSSPNKWTSNLALFAMIQYLCI